MKKRSLPIFFLLHSLFLLSQTPQISGIINRYTAVSAVDTCSGRLSISDTTGFRKGDAALLIQMQGASINTGNNAQYGSILAMNDAGRFERVIVDSVAAGAVYVAERLIYGFSQPAGLQLVRISQFNDVIVNDTLRAKPWDGVTGGVLALEASGTLTLNAPVWVSGAGFRGGGDFVAANNNCNWFTQQNQFVYASGDWRGGFKGEGIAQAIAGQELGRGPRANGGGGGNDHNAGGGGGGNISAGGNGGNNADPNPIGCNGYFPGLGGAAPATAVDRLFMGGGGGAGHANNLLRSRGGRGGGIVFIRAGSINGAKTEIFANGEHGSHSFDDGAGGGGGGGSIWLSINTPNPALLLSANGGRGGNADNGNVDRCMGPGGGGSGGRILCNNMSVNALFSPGAPGNTINSTVGCNNSTNGAQTGGAGFFEFLSMLPQGANPYFQPEILSAIASDTVCEDDQAIFSVLTNGDDWAYQWEVNYGAGWQTATGANFGGAQSADLTVFSAQTAQFRCRVQRPGCYEAVSNAASLHILPAPTAGFSSSQNGATVSFNNLSINATGFIWDFGDGLTSTLPHPSHTYLQEGNFTVTLTAWNACDTAVFESVVGIFLPPQADFFAPSSVIACESASINLVNLSSDNSSTFNWTMSGGQPAVSSEENPTVMFNTSGTYTIRLVVTNMAGSDTLEQTVSIEIFDNPTAEFSWSVLPNGTVVFSNLSTNADAWNWDFGDGSSNSNTFNATHTYTAGGVYVVTLSAVSPCGVSLIQQEIEVNLPGSGWEEITSGPFEMYPNPAANQVWLDWRRTGRVPVSVSAFDMSGREIKAIQVAEVDLMEIAITDWPSGIYIIRATFPGGIVSRLLVKRTE